MISTLSPANVLPATATTSTNLPASAMQGGRRRFRKKSKKARKSGRKARKTAKKSTRKQWWKLW